MFDVDVNHFRYFVSILDHSFNILGCVYIHDFYFSQFNFECTQNMLYQHNHNQIKFSLIIFTCTVESTVGIFLTIDTIIERPLFKIRNQTNYYFFFTTSRSMCLCFVFILSCTYCPLKSQVRIVLSVILYAGVLMGKQINVRSVFFLRWFGSVCVCVCVCEREREREYWYLREIV